jgi:transcription initiation factor IIF auxiliary subunit
MVRRKTHNWIEWEVFMNEPPEVLEQVSEVEYVLHKTFPEPIRTIDDRSTRFALRSSGWGMFHIQITVLMKDGREISAGHMLDFNRPWPPGH